MPRPPISRRGAERGRTNYRRGRMSEYLSRWWLRLKGYRIIAHNWRCRHGEIDIIAQSLWEQTLVFIEVKLRHTYDVSPITPRQAQRLHNAALAFVQRHPSWRHCTMRWDILLWRSFWRVHHIRNIWPD